MDVSHALSMSRGRSACNPRRTRHPAGKHLAQMDVATPIIVALIVLITGGTVFGLLI
jgi:hypothetical protein